MRFITRSRSDCDRSDDSGSASMPCFCRKRATVPVSSRVLQKMIALSGCSWTSTFKRSRARAMPLTM